MLKILVLLLSVIAVPAQIEIAKSKHHNFYIYSDSIFRFKDKVLFTAKVTHGRTSRRDIIHASCSKQTYVLVSSEITTNNITTWVTPHNPKILPANKNSAIEIALDILCRIKPDEEN